MKPMHDPQGLEQLIWVLHEHGIETASLPPVNTMPKPGEFICGLPLDPMLAKAYTLCNGGTFGDMRLFRGVDDQWGLEQENAYDNQGSDARYKSVFRFAVVDDLAHYLGTVPSLAGTQGLQPGVMTSDYEFDIFPIASNVDRTFELYALYSEVRLKTYGSLKWDPHGPHDSIHFPFSFVNEIAQDRDLVQMLEDGRFEALTAPAKDSAEWVKDILAAAHGPK